MKGCSVSEKANIDNKRVLFAIFNIYLIAFKKLERGDGGLSIFF